jgi:hypothetical protein
VSQKVSKTVRAVRLVGDNRAGHLRRYKLNFRERNGKIWDGDEHPAAEATPSDR